MKSSLLFLALLIFFTVSRLNAAEELIYTVRPGDNLWNLANIHLKEAGYYRRLQEYNAVQQPLRLKPGTRLKIPVSWLKNTPAHAKVVSVIGTVQLISGTDLTINAAKAGDTLTAGDKIKTGDDGSMTVSFADGSKLSLKPGTELLMDALSAYGDGSMIDTRLRMQYGRMDTDVPSKRDSSSHFEINTPAAVSIVRGTNFRVSAENNRPLSRIEVLQGAVDVSAASVTRIVPAGFGTMVEAGNPPIEPRQLLPAPDIKDWPKQVRQLPITLLWSPLDGAVAYRMQLGKASDEALLLIDRKLTANEYELPALPDDLYILQLRGIDELGLEGVNAVHSLNLDVHPLAPILVKPEMGEKVYQSELSFHWQAVEESDYYLIQIAKDSQFNKIVEEKKLSATQFVTEIKQPAGTFYWRVASYRDAKTVGPLSVVWHYRILHPPPVIGLVGRETNGIRFQWQDIAQSSAYQFQLSSKFDFSNITKQLETTENSVVLPNLPVGTYFYRVRVIDVDGYKSLYSAVGQYIHESAINWPLYLSLFFPLVL